MLRFLMVCAIAMNVSGCALFNALDSGTRSVLQGGTSFTASVPVTIKQEYTVETVYNSAMRSYREYLRLPTCPPGVAFSATNYCRDAVTVAKLSHGRITIVEPAMARARAAQRSGGVSAFNVLEDVKNAIANWQRSVQ